MIYDMNCNISNRELLYDKVSLTIKLPLNKQAQLVNIMESHKLIRGWLITHISINPNGRTEIEAERISDDYRKFLHNCRLEDLNNETNYKIEIR